MQQAKGIHLIAVLAFGLIVPLLLLGQAGYGLWSLTETLAQRDQATISEILTGLQPSLKSANDYSLTSQLLAERVNQQVITNKQIMKAAVMQIGFAVASVGLMFVILGVTDGGAETEVSRGDIKINMKTSSTGIVVFVVGAAMAAAGGTMKNEYTTVSIPPFNSDAVQQPPEIEDFRTAIDAYKRCSADKSQSSGDCFFHDFGEIKKGYPE